MLVMMNVDEIRIPTIYTHTPPRKEKIDNSMLYYMEHGALKSNIVVTQKGLLIDGYCSYIVAVVCGISSVQCEINTKFISRRVDGKNRKVNNAQHKRKILYHRQNGKCAVCGMQLQIDDCTSEDYLTLDHILPVSKGGCNGLMNLQGLCRHCNYQKQDDYKEDTKQ